MVACNFSDSEQNVSWCKPFTWCEVDALTAIVRNEIVSHQGKIDTVKLVKFTVDEVNKQWKRKEFKDFEYLEIELPAWCHWLVWIMTILVNIGLAIYVVRNDIKEKN